MKKVAAVSRVCPHYMVPVYRELAKQVDLRVFFGDSPKTGSQQNTKKITEFRYKRLFTIPISLSLKGMDYFLPLHPTIIFHLIRGKFDFIISEGASNLFNLFYIFAYCKTSKTPLIIRDAGRIPNSSKSVQRKLADHFLKYMYKGADAIIAYGSVAKEYMISVGVPQKKVFIAQNTIDTQQINEDIKRFSEDEITKKRKALGLEGKKIILYVGALEKRKKIENLLSAFSKITKDQYPVVLLIIGDGSYRKKLEEYVIINRIAHVMFLGRIVEDIGVFFLMCNLFVLPAQGGLAINQAMAYGKPVIATSSDGTEADLIKNNENGYIIEKNNINQLYKTMQKVLVSPGLEKQIGKKAQALIMGHYNLDNMINGILEAINNV